MPKKGFKQERCYLCGASRPLSGYKIHYEPEAFHKEPKDIVIDLCTDCTYWADRFYDAIYAIVIAREGRK